MTISPRLPLISVAAARALALFLGAFSLLNLLGERLVPNFDANEWWIDLRLCPHRPRQILLLAAALSLLFYAFRPRLSRARFWLTQVLLGALLLAAILNIASFYLLLFRGDIHVGVPIPFSLAIATALAFIMYSARLPDPPPLWNGRGVTTFAIVLAACFLLAPLGQMFCFGKTDYRRPADAIIILGARVFADGQLSDAAAERTLEAITLYRSGLAPLLIFSGGPGDGPISEPEAMRNYAIREGVPTEAILLDPRGLNTEATVHNTLALCQAHHATPPARLLVVSHFYHLPRIKMAYQRAGQEVRTVPVHSPYMLRRLPRYMLREIVALWAYYLEPLGVWRGKGARAERAGGV